MNRKFLTFLCSGLILLSCQQQEKKEMIKKISEKSFNIPPPIAKKVDYEHSLHGIIRKDPYFWMRLSDEQKSAASLDSHTTSVYEYLNQENAYAKAVLQETEELQQKLYNEIVGRIEQTDVSVPYNYNKYTYFTRMEEGKEYPIYSRRLIGDPSNPEEILLDVNQMAEGYAYFSAGPGTVSFDNKILAFGTDTVSRRIYTLYFKDLETGELLKDQLSGTTGRAVWAKDNKTVFYTVKDPVTLRSSQIYKHVLGTTQAEDELVFEEKDVNFSAYVGLSKSREYIFITCASTVSTEVQYLASDEPNGKFKVIQERERNLEYDVDHLGEDFFIRTNLNARNFKVVKTSLSNTGKENWEDVIPAREDVYLEGFELFNDYLVIEERKDGLIHLQVRPWEGEPHYISFNDPAYVAGISINPEMDSNVLRYVYTSLTTPYSTFDYNLETREQELLKQTKVLGEFSPEDYVSERIWATASDGVKIPVSLVYKKGTELKENNPLLLYAYGSYGASMDPYFSSVRLSLLDRGFVFAIAHIRGGQELGREWYESGKMLQKKNTFTDYISCAEHLKNSTSLKVGNLYAMGGSAGGLLMGAVANMRPDLFHGMIAQVPFVDVVTTMLDETIPLTTGEYDEWGNPNNKEYFEYMLSYSPYDNVKEQEYPHMLVTTGLFDSQVQYWEPAKWVAKLRSVKQGDNLLLFDCNMETGHGGASGRYQKYKEVAKEYAFLLMLEGKSSAPVKA